MAAWRGRQTALKCSVAEFQTYLKGLSFGDWRPAGMTLHNTAAPTLVQYFSSPPVQRMENLKAYYMGLGWSAGPHAFVDGNDIWVFTDFNVRGVHSPSWNGTRLGVEMVGDYNVEDDDSGQGLKVKMMTARLFAICHGLFGWEPSATSIKLHKEDPATDHDCPGKHIDKSEFIRLVGQYLGEGGDHEPPKDYAKKGGVVASPDGTLNLREASSASAHVLAVLRNDAPVVVVDEVLNGATKWYRVQAEGRSGWVAARFVLLVEPEGPLRLEEITATEFGGPGETQESAYGGMLDARSLGCALPYKFRRGRPPGIQVIGPSGSRTIPVVDVGPHNIDNPEYVLQGRRPMAEQQYRDKTRSQNGLIPTQPAGVDLTPPTAEAVGIRGIGKVTVVIPRGYS